MKTIGVLALQGGFDPHLRMLKSLGVQAVPVRTLAEIQGCDGLVLPGGESTTIGKLLVLQELLLPLKDLMAGGLPVFGTCAGLILLSMSAVGRQQPLLEVLDVDVARNAYGRQTESFETTLDFDDGLEKRTVPGVFIRAPQIVRIGPSVRVLVRYEGLAACVRQDRILAASFHPELTSDPALHDYFLTLV